ncbi:MAG TPA: gephyrin-like molybdotransferase Glp [Candidatus Dormibacteraeota bacterium]
MKISTYPMLDAEVVAGLVLERAPLLPVEEVAIGGWEGRVLAQDVRAPRDLPRWPVSAVDGYAVRSADGGGRLRVAGESAAGRPLERALGAGEAAVILTGGVLPDGADSVVMAEDAQADGDTVVVPANPASGANYHRPGADARAEEVLLAAGTELGPAEIGLAASLALDSLPLRRHPRVALLSTGDELFAVGADVDSPGRIPDSNRHALRAALVEAGARVTSLGIAPDDAAGLRQLVERALEDADVVVTSGGVSVGTHDLVKPLLEELGEVHCGRVKLRPGKPFTFATLRGGKLAFGLPGFPVSSLVTFEVFVRPALRKMLGCAELQRPRLAVRLGYDAAAAGDRTEYQRVSLVPEGSAWVAHTTGSQSSSRLKSLAGAHALVRIPPGADPIPAGSEVQAILLRLPAIPPQL